MELVSGDIAAEAQQVFKNLLAVAEASGGTLDDAVKINISLTDLNDFEAVNTVMASHFSEPYPARACVQVAALPRGARIEVEAILAL
jgi:reactive intermediate/imine deaminase